MIDTAGTICAAAQQLRDHGASEIYVMATDGVLSDPAVERLEAAPVDRVVVTDSIDVRAARSFAKLEVLSLAPLMAAAVKAIFADESVSKIFGGENQI
jgi:ribose-phosphate pyrophosphokinase